MACPTCDHTMERVDGLPEVRRVFVCPRCGTLKVEVYTGDPNHWHVSVSAPKLVTRCRAFEKVLVEHAEPGSWIAAALESWRREGVAESINLPGDRP